MLRVEPFSCKDPSLIWVIDDECPIFSRMLTLEEAKIFAALLEKAVEKVEAFKQE